MMDGALIAGVNGFIGGHLARRLLRLGARVRGFDLAPAAMDPRVEYLQADLTDAESLRAAVRGARVLFHCTRWNGQPPTWDAARAVEITGTENLLGACLREGVERVVHLGSLAAYGPTRQPVITEETPLWPIDVYGRSKVGAEVAVAGAQRAGLAVVVLRSGQVYGPGAFGGTVHFVRRIRAGHPVLADGGRGIACPVYIQHLLDALIAGATREGAAGETFNVADDNLPWREFLGYYARMCGRRLRSVPGSAIWLYGLAAEGIGWLRRRTPLTHRTLVHYMTRASRVITEKARTILGWTPARPMAEAMAETEAWLRAEGLLPDR